MSSEREVRATPRLLSPSVLDGGTGLHRPRLSNVLRGRFARTATVLRAGPGFGKTTLLRQALAENRLEPHGIDVGLVCTERDADAEHLLGGLMEGLGASGPSSVERIADAIWNRSPMPVALVFDDVHLLPNASAGARALGQLMDALGAQAHLVFSGRTRPPVALARLRSEGRVEVLDEDALAFASGEADALAGTAAVHFPGDRNWPALVALRIAAGPEAVDEYIWEEVLDRRPQAQREALACTAHVEWLDDDLIETLLGEGWTLARLFDDLPLVTRDAEGRGRLHPLWRPYVAALPGASQPRHRIHAARALRERGRFLEALEHARAAQDTSEVEACTYRIAVNAWDRFSVDELREALALASITDPPSPAQTLLQARMRLRIDPARARGLLEAARLGFERAGDPDGEIAALNALGRMAIWDGDPAAFAIGLEHARRLQESGCGRAESFLALGAASTALIKGDSAEVLRCVDRARAAGGADGPLAAILAGLAALNAGEAQRTLGEIATLGTGEVPPNLTGTWAALAFTARWSLGQTTTAEFTDADVSYDADQVEGNHNLALFTASAALVFAIEGDRERAERHLHALESIREYGLGNRVDAPVRYARAALALDSGDESAAATEIAGLVEGGALEPPVHHQRHRNLALVYVLAPDAREKIDALSLGPLWALGRELGRALVAGRAGDGKAAASLDWSRPERFRPQIPAALQVELWLAAVMGGGRPPEAWLPADARRFMRFVRDRERGALGEIASEWLRRVASPPQEAIRLNVLGEARIFRGDALVEDDGWRRERVRSLLLLLVGRGRLRREEAAVELWPDKDDAAAANNLRVNLNHLLRVLEPGRQAGEPSWFIRQESERLELSDHLEVDAVEFEQACADGDRAGERDEPALALECYERAIPLYRGDYMEDLPDAEWAEADRTRLRMCFVRATRRAGELHLGANRPERALELAESAIEVEPLDEGAHRLLIRAYQARGDRAAARRTTAHALHVLADAGLQPEPLTLAVAREIGIDEESAT